MGVEWKYTNRMTFKELRADWRSTNLARPVPIREEAIMEYASLMEAGSPAPAVILHKTESGYDVLDGLQRLGAAHLADCTHFPAYVVTCDSKDVLISIRILANPRLQGRPEPPEWTRRQAVKVLVVQQGMTIEEVSRMGGWRPKDVEKTATALQWNDSIQAIGATELSDAMISTLAQFTTQEELSTQPEPISGFLEKIKTARFSATDAEPYVKNFFLPAKASKKYAIYKQRLGEFLSDPEVQVRLRGRKVLGLAKDVNLRRTLKAAVTILDDIDATNTILMYADEFFQLLNQIEQKIRSVSPSHPRPVTSPTPADKWGENA